MTTLDEVAAFRTAIGDVTTLAVRDVESLLLSLDASDPIGLRDALYELLPVVVQQYGGISAQLAEEWYVELRSQVERARYAAATTEWSPDRAQLDAMVRRAMGPLFGQSDSTVLALLSGSVQRLVADAARGAVIANVQRDKIRVGWARVPQPGCCAFCAMLASRGADYGSKDTAGFKSHDACRCVAAPAFAGDDELFDLASTYETQYRQSLVFTPSGAVDLKGTLAAMRVEHGIR